MLLSKGMEGISHTRESNPGSEFSDADFDADDNSDGDFDANTVPLNANEKMDAFCDTWIRSLDRD